MRGIDRKWRPPLALVIGGTLAAVFSLPIIGIVYLRLAGDILGWAETAWLIGWMAVISTALLGFLLWRLVLRPVYALTRYARAMKAGGDAPAPDHFGTPELSTLGASVMAMGESLHNRAEGMRAYAHHVTHELKSPLTAIAGAAELLRGQPGPGDAAALAETISVASARMQVLLDDLVRHAQASEPGGSGQSTLGAALEGLDVPVTVTVAQDAVLPLTVQDVRTVLIQVLRNAAEHGATEVTLMAADGRLAITDNGPGISAGNRDRIFDPFFTTRRDRGGTGMGLSIVRSLVQARGGRISLADDSGSATFVIEFD